MDTKTCTKCRVPKDRSEFGANPRKKDGLNYVCKDCQNIYCREHYKQNKQTYIDKMRRRKEAAVAFVENYKSTRACPYCGESDPACLDFHHRDPADKLHEICDLSNSGCAISTLIKEIEKCILLCSNCHRKYHAGRLVL